jgi:hypothetical protein
MTDMLVNLRNLPSKFEHDEIAVRRANAWDKQFVFNWVKAHFSESWAECCDVAFEQRPVSCFLIVEKGVPNHPQDLLLGFACYDVAGKGVFGPMGVLQVDRNKGLGSALLVNTLHAIRDEGYIYSVIGQIGPASFYTKVVGATLIEGSDPGSARTHLSEV